MRAWSAAILLLALPVSGITLRDVPRAYASSDTHRILVTDFDLDGNPDVVTDGSPTLAILFGRGDGSLEPMLFPGTESSTLIADFDGDRYPDLISIASAGVMLRRNLGGRRFEAARPLLDSFAEPRAAADFTGDGAPDVLLTAGSGALLLVNDGHGAFTTKVVLGGIAMDWGDPAVGDVDGDGDLDLTMLYYGSVHVFLNSGPRGNDFLFTRQPGIDTSAVPMAADLDGDRRADIVALRFGSHEIAVHPGGDASTRTVAPSGRSPWNGAFGDYNNDGALDLAVLHDASGPVLPTEREPPTVVLYLGDGRGGLARASEVVIGSVLRRGIAAADFDHDGALDLAVPAESGVAIVRGKGDGTFRVATAGAPGIRHGNVYAAPDFNGDGIDELVLLSDSPGVRIGWMNADGTYRFDTVPVPGAFYTAKQLVDAKRASLVLVDNQTIRVLATSAPGEWRTTSSFDVGDTIRTLRVWRERIAVVVGMTENATLKVFTAGGELAFSAPLTPSPSKHPTYGNPFVIHATDADRDGVTDLIVTALRSGWIYDFTIYSDGYALLFRGRADGTFAPPSVLFADQPLINIAVTDFNADAVPDLAFSNGSAVTTLYGDGEGHFLPRETGFIGIVPDLVADLNLDGLTDFKRGPEIVFGTSDGRGRLVRYLGTSLGTVLARRKPTGPPSLVGTVPWRGDLYFVDLAAETRGRAARH